MTRISVVMGAYNGGSSLGETLDSLMVQTDRDLEIIVVDDGSTDETPALLDRYARRDARLVVIRQPRAGLTSALIAGCNSARGDYIARQDVGDLSHPLRLRLQSEALDQSENLILVSCWTSYVGPENEPLYESRGLPSSAVAGSILDPQAAHGVVDGPTHHGSAMFRRDAYVRAGGYRRAFYYGQDWDLWYRLGEVGDFMIVQQTLYVARVTPASISSSSRVDQQRIAALAKEAFLARRRGESDQSIVARAATIRPSGHSDRCARSGSLYFIGEALRRNGDVRCRRYLLQAALACPLSAKAWVRLVQSVLLDRLAADRS